MVEPFTVWIDDAELADAARRLAATRWLENVAATSADPPTLAFAQSLAEHWPTRFDWRALEARINAQPNVLVTVDGLKLHAIHRRSSRADARPLILIHGWPTSVLEFLEVIDALAEPGATEPAFHVVVPSLPGYGWSETRAGVSPRRAAHLLAAMMAALGHDRYLVQGGNWGSTIGTEMAREYPERLIGLHLNCVNGTPPPPGMVTQLSAEDQEIADTYATLLGYPHFNLLVQEPLAVAHAMNDSPAGLAAWLGAKLRGWADPALPGNPALAPEWAVATAALYWFTRTAGSSQMLYREAVLDPGPERYVRVPTAVAHFRAETVMIPRPWAERHYNIADWARLPEGGHYPAYEVPARFVAELRRTAPLLASLEPAGG